MGHHLIVSSDSKQGRFGILIYIKLGCQLHISPIQKAIFIRLSLKTATNKPFAKMKQGLGFEKERPRYLWLNQLERLPVFLISVVTVIVFGALGIVILKNKRSAKAD